MAEAEAKAKGKKTLRIRQVRSSIGTIRTHREVLRGLGLRRIRHEVVREDTPATRGAIKKIEYLLEVAEVGSEERS
jgi:large subunit ribosomal protein L30